jgi:hypothetical protein
MANGIVLIRLAGLSSTKKAALTSSMLDRHAEEIQQAFSVITPASIRIRKLNL